MKIRSIVGKTIKSAEATTHEASDSCVFATIEFRFTDGSMYSLCLQALPQVHGMLFKSDNDDNATEVELVKP
jgi:hypothetical protein